MSDDNSGSGSGSGSASGYSGPLILSSGPLTATDIALGQQIAKKYGLEEKAMTDALSREELEQVVRNSQTPWRDVQKGAAEKIMAHDAALRAQLQQVEQLSASRFLEICKMESDCIEHCQDWTHAQLKLNEANKQLTAAQAEIARLNELLEQQRLETYRAIEREHTLRDEIATIKKTVQEWRP